MICILSFEMIKFLDIKKITDSFQPAIGEAIHRVVDSGYFVSGSELQLFEQAYASFAGTKYCVGVASGLDALRLIFKAYLELGHMREGDEIIVPANTYIASILSITDNRLTPVLVEPDLNTYNIAPDRIEEKITARTKGIMIVHLYGKNAMHPEIKRIAERHHLRLIEDNAQAAGCFYGDQRTGSLGDAAGHSFFPTKNLGALGDAGAITTDDNALATLVRSLGNYGAQKKGVNDVQGINSRLDELQAAVLSVKLSRLDTDNARRQKAAQYYLDHITHPKIYLPQDHAAQNPAKEHVWHLFVIRCSNRDDLQRYLKHHGIETLIHYPIPPHKQKAYISMNHLTFPITELIHREVLSLPISPVMEDDEVRRVVEVVNGFPVGGFPIVHA